VQSGNSKKRERRENAREKVVRTFMSQQQRVMEKYAYAYKKKKKNRESRVLDENVGKVIK
jgi:hypothetical protein